MNGKKVAMKQRIAELIIAKRTFDVSINKDGLRTVSQMIAKEMCESQGLSFAQTIDAYPQYCRDVKNNLGHAILYLEEDMKIPAYRGIEPKTENVDENGTSYQTGGKFIEYLTIDIEYRNAKQDELTRIRNILNKTLGACQRQVGVIAPQRDFGLLVAGELKKIA